MESLSDFTDTYESVLRACEAYYDNIKDPENLVLFRRNWMQLRRISPKLKEL